MIQMFGQKILLTISNLRKNSKNSDKENYVQSGYGITFDKAGSQSFYNGTARNATTICTDINSSSHAEITRIMFYCQIKVQLLVSMEALVQQRKGLVLISVKQT